MEHPSTFELVPSKLQIFPQPLPQLWDHMTCSVAES